MPTKRPPGSQYLKNPPRGMWYEDRAGKPLPALARWRTADGLKEGQSFADAQKRAEFAATWVTQRQRLGMGVGLVGPREVSVWEEFKKITNNAHPLTVAREWVVWRGVTSTASIADLWAEFNADQEKRKLSPDTHSHRRLHGKRLCSHFAGKMAASVQPDELSAWIAGLLDEDTGEPMSSKTRGHHLKTANHFFGWLRDRRKIIHNPGDAVTTPDATLLHPETGEPIHKDVNILTVEQGRELFRANRDALCIGRLALEAFGGLRYTSAARLRPADIAWDDSGIVMPGHQHKSTNRHFVDGWTPNLWQWMRHAHKAGWDISRRQYADLKREAFERAGLKPKEPEDDREWTTEEAARLDAMHNALRHSFATYHLAAFKDSKLTSHLMTKTSIQSLNNDYRGRATQADGAAWFQIVP